jgi:hypothetical protein
MLAAHQEQPAIGIEHDAIDRKRWRPGVHA